MQGKTVLITGGTGGIGKYTAIGLAKRGATVVVTGRNKARGQTGVDKIKSKSASKDVH
jgi:retinol dehydrogenase 14